MSPPKRSTDENTVEAGDLDEQDQVRLRHVRVGAPLPDGRYTILTGVNMGERVALDPQAAVLLLKEQRKESASHE